MSEEEKNDLSLSKVGRGLRRPRESQGKHVSQTHFTYGQRGYMEKEEPIRGHS